MKLRIYVGLQENRDSTSKQASVGLRQSTIAIALKGKRLVGVTPC